MDGSVTVTEEGNLEGEKKTRVSRRKKKGNKLRQGSTGKRGFRNRRIKPGWNSSARTAEIDQTSSRIVKNPFQSVLFFQTHSRGGWSPTSFGLLYVHSIVIEVVEVVASETFDEGTHLSGRVRRSGRAASDERLRFLEGRKLLVNAPRVPLDLSRALFPCEVDSWLTSDSDFFVGFEDDDEEEERGGLFNSMQGRAGLEELTSVESGFGSSHFGSRSFQSKGGGGNGSEQKGRKRIEQLSTRLLAL